jgi:copper chaperone
MDSRLRGNDKVSIVSNDNPVNHQRKLHMETTTLNIGGMTCMGCVASVTRVLKAASGVADAQVTLTPPQARVQYDAAITGVEKLKASVEDAGFDAT